MQLFANNGCNCWAIVHCEDPDFLNKIHTLEKENNVWIKPVYMELDNSDSIKQGMKDILAEKLPVDILVNAAGIVSPNRLFTMTKMEDIRRVMDVNFFSAIELTQLVCRPMMRQRKGSIINIASIAAWGEDTSQMEYAASKAAMVIATKKLARELGSAGIRVNAVAPGLTQTKMLDVLEDEAEAQIKKGLGLHRFGTPEEIAEVCLFLASDKSSYVTGETIKVDGGGTDLRLSISK
ncbi:MAG: SDR family oxidoreductase [Bacteroidaceae bacterium]|nr:SDR family oxidoreductase [Bacteroidaceae bacterium]